MTNDEINKTIATHIFGFEDYDMLLSFSGAPERKLYGATKFANTWTPVPDYCNDLNAIHDVKSTLKGDKRIGFIDILCEVVKRDKNISEGPYSTMVESFYATAKQQSEAFLKTIGKWEE